MSALLPALGNFAGGVHSDMFGASTHNLALHTAAWIVVAGVVLELMPSLRR